MKKLLVLGTMLMCTAIVLLNSSCKSCNKKEEATAPKVDSTKTQASAPIVSLPRADTSLIPIMQALLEDAFDAAQKKDYAKFGSLLVYRGPDQNRHGMGVYSTKTAYEKKVVQMHAEVFSKWVKEAETIEYTRLMEMDQPDGRAMLVMEVVFASRQNVRRLFFGFLDINGEPKIADVTYNLM